MKNCRDMRRDLSAYLDGELTQAPRAEVEAHLASCVRCQRELLEMKTLATGLSVLPKLRPAPRFLAEVRRKIAHNEEPEALTWQDYVFRPLWLKVPLEVAALIVIIGLVMRSEHLLPAQKAASLEFAKAENGGKTISSETTTAETPTSSVVGLVRSMEFPRSKPGEIVTVHARVFDDVRNQAQQLATRCNGRVVVVPPSKGATEQTLFVELPQEYVAAFRLELLKTTGPSAALAKGGSGGEPGTASVAALSAGVLTGSAPTNNSTDGLAAFGLGDNTPIAAPATLMEIRVVAPAN